ncbi:MAG TPA: hypothetical protein VKT83_06135 [bacterium]|nr:hypothetical protein [bacterium]
MVRDLPTDDECLDQIYSCSKDDLYIAETWGLHQASLPNLEAEFRELVEAGILESDKFEDFRVIAEETGALDKAFRGRFVQFLKDKTLSFTGDDRNRLRGIPVGLLPSWELNACAIQTPRGGVVIILNQGIIRHVTLIYRCALAFMTWKDEEPFCRDAPQQAYGGALIGLAQYAVTGDFSHVLHHRAGLVFPSLKSYENSTILFSLLMEIFILLHEYGHVVKDHLSPDKVSPAFAGKLPNMHQYTKSQRQEFEADQYAIDRLSSKVVGRVQPHDLAFAPGLVLKFLELCECVAQRLNAPLPKTHPPAGARWERIKMLTGLPNAKGSFVLRLEPAFDILIRSLQRA